MAFIRTVLGDIDPAASGIGYAHEHIIIDPGFATMQTPDFLLDCVEAAVAELQGLKTAGVGLVVDSMPCDAGRNVEKLAEASRRSGVGIVCPTGLHLQQYYPPNHWGERLPEDTLAELFVADIMEGVDANDYGGPVVRRTSHRAGVIKVAGGRDCLSAHERKCFRAAAQAQRQTGCPILTHTEQGTAAEEQIRLLREHGADLGRVVLSHTDRLPEPDYHRRLLRAGVVLEYDSAFRWKTGDLNPTVDLIAALLPEFPTQIVVGMDAARRSYWKAYGGGPGLSYLVTTLRPLLANRGLSEMLLDNLYTHNPRRAYTFTGAGATFNNA